MTPAAGQAGSYSFTLARTTQVTVAVNTTASGTLAGTADAQLFRVPVTAASPLLVRFDAADDASRNEVYVKFGTPPTRADYDYRYPATAADQNVLVPTAQAGDWYVLVYAASVPAPTAFTLRPVASSVFAFGSTPARSGQAASAPLTITGAGFLNGTRVQLLDAANAVAATAVTDLDSYTQVTAAFDLRAVAPGAYSVRITAPGGGFDILANALTVTPAGQPHLETRLILPGTFGRHSTSTIYVEYANTGDAPMPAPLIRLQSADADNSDHPLLTLDQSRVIQGYWKSGTPDGFAESVQILGSGSSPGVLNPGERIRVPVYYIGLLQPWNFSDTSVEMELRIFDAANTDPVPWATLKDGLRPATIRTDAWDAIYGNLQANVGPTWGAFVQMLSDNAVFLSRLDQPTTDVSQLWSSRSSRPSGSTRSAPWRRRWTRRSSLPGPTCRSAAATPCRSTSGSKPRCSATAGRPPGRRT